MAKKTTINPSKREAREARRRREQTMKMVKWGGLAVLGLAVIGLLVWLGTRPATAMGDEVTIISADHVAEGSDSGPYASDPPAGGKHYPSEYNPGFYEEDQVETLPKPHEGYLVHNLEHGYVIFWYNCQADPQLNCDELKQTIRSVMDTSGTDELIAFPWPSLEEPLAMTSWGRIMRFDALDEDQMREFVRLNLNKSPEPEAR